MMTTCSSKQKRAILSTHAPAPGRRAVAVSDLPLGAAEIECAAEGKAEALRY